MLFCKFLILDKMGESELRVVVWHCRIYIEHLHLIQKRGFFFPQVLYLDLLCGIRVFVVPSRKVETAEPLWSMGIWS